MSEPILQSQAPYWLLLLTALGSSIISGIISLIIALKVEKKKIRPQVTAHECRVYGNQVYTHFDENNKISRPACPFIAKDGSNKCNYEIKDSDQDKEDKERILEINKGICYLSLWLPSQDKQ
jgi:hypothetical protein